MNNSGKFYRSTGLILTFMTVITFIFALRAVPISGAFSPTDPIQYPYLNTVAQFPNDYIWMYLAIFMLITFIVFMMQIDSVLNKKNSILIKISLMFSKFSGLLLITTYFLQAEVLPINIILEQYNGISLFTQYNPFGMFIALEVLGYISMSVSLLLIAPLFNRSKSERFLRAILIISFMLVVLSYIGLAIIYGLQKMERFEVTIICITWLDLIILGIISFINKGTIKDGDQLFEE